MGYQTFHDADGIEWEVWAVVAPPETARFGQRPTPDWNQQLRIKALQGSWLVFESSDLAEKRRLQPVPPEWMKATAAELSALCRRATPAKYEEWKTVAAASGREWG